MKYNIISIDDTRQRYKDSIRSRVSLDEVSIPSVDARRVDLDEELKRRGLRVTSKWPMTVGEIGVWLSVFDCWQWAAENNEELVVFEDDAIPEEDFNEQFALMKSELDDGYSFLTLWVPENQKQDFLYMVWFEEDGTPHVSGNLPEQVSVFDCGKERLARAYCGYGNVAMLFSPTGAKYLLDHAREVGIYTPVDCFQYIESHTQRCEGYAPKPRYATMVAYDWPETTIHTTQKYEG